MTELKTFTISGTAWRRIVDGGWQMDCPEGYEAFKAGVSRKAGKGFRVTMTMEELHAVDLAAYLESVAEVLEGMSPDERGSDGAGTARACRRAMDTIVETFGPWETCLRCGIRIKILKTRKKPYHETVGAESYCRNLPCDCSDGGQGWLLDQTYGEAEIPEGWKPVQACDICMRFTDDKEAARQAANHHGTMSSWFPAAAPEEEEEPGHGDWAINLAE